MATDEQTRRGRKYGLEAIAQRVKVEYEFLRRAWRWSPNGSRTAVDADASSPLHGDSPLSELVTGMFVHSSTLKPYYETDKVVIWCAVTTTAFAFILDNDENRLLANIVLKFIVKYLQDYGQAMTKPKDIVSKPDVVMNIIDCLLPEGQLRFMNHKVVKDLERNLEQMVSSGRMKSGRAT